MKRDGLDRGCSSSSPGWVHIPRDRDAEDFWSGFVRIPHVRYFVVPSILVALTGCGDLELAEDAHWVTFRDRERGFAVRYPADWERAEVRLTPVLADPRELLSVGTFALRAGGNRCSHVPVRALEDFGSRDAFISIQERAEPRAGEFEPRTDFRAPTARRTGRFCVPDAQRLDDWLFFSDAGRGFYAIVALGTEASPTTRRELVEVLKSLEFEPRP
jgi:hypothetical protein